MKRPALFLAVVQLILISAALLHGGPVPFKWKRGEAAQLGFSPTKLQQLCDSLAARGTAVLLIARGDRIVFEWYAPGRGPQDRHYSASLAKALVGGTSLVLALGDGSIHLDEPACRTVPAWGADSKRSKITFRQLATHCSGIEDAELSAEERQRRLASGLTRTDMHTALPGWKGAFWRREPDPFSIARDSAPVIFTPGQRYAYSNPGMAMLAYAVTAAAGLDLRSLLQNRVFDPLGLDASSWSVGYGRTYPVNGLELVPNWGGGAFTARAVARLGLLWLNEGRWQGRSLLDSSWVRRAVRYAGTPKNPEPAAPAPGLCWYVNSDGAWPGLPRDSYAGAGAGHQLLLIVPGLDLIAVRQGGDLSREKSFWVAARDHFFTPLMAAFEEAPYPRSRILTGAEFAPESTIVRLAMGSDNWPNTWADDGALYTAYGDGWGFEPRTGIKLSLGFARVYGDPPGLNGENIRSRSGERVGDGASGAKASGMLMINNVLYMLVRNTDHSQLAWSRDHGRTWEWSDWKFTASFGCPTFANYGRNYDGARDAYVYIYSPESAGAYQGADELVLARVHRDSLCSRRAYRFYAGLDAGKKPRWSIDISRRAPVFRHPGRCYRTSVCYSPEWRRFLLCHTLPGGLEGMGIFEAPEPWGPWSTVFFTTKWDVPPGESCSLPRKWFSADGRSAFLLFSGGDAFCLRRLTFRADQGF